MDNIHQYVDGIASNAVLLAGFTAFFSISPGDDTDPYLAGFYYLTSVLCLVCNIYIVVCSSLLGALGPTYGLCGKGMDSMHHSVALMKKERKKMMAFFFAGFFLFGLCELSAVWIECDNILTNILCTSCIVIGFFYIQYEIARMKKEFKFEEFHADEHVEGAASTLLGCASPPTAATAKQQEKRRSSAANMTTADEYLSEVRLGGIALTTFGNINEEGPNTSERQISIDPMSSTKRY
jgi:hypothetical protein